jgi:hypothetical protein
MNCELRTVNGYGFVNLRGEFSGNLCVLCVLCGKIGLWSLLAIGHCSQRQDGHPKTLKGYDSYADSGVWKRISASARASNDKLRNEGDTNCAMKAIQTDQ